MCPGEDGAADDGKDSKSAKTKRSHFGRAVSLKNFIMRKGKSTSVEQGEGAKGEEAAEGGEAGGAADEAAAATEETDDKDAAAGKKSEAEKTPAEAPVTNGENSCSNGTAEEHATHNHQEEEKTTGGSPVKNTKEAGAKEEANAKIINATAAVNSGELERAQWDDEPQQSSSKEGDTNNRQHQQQQQQTTSVSCKQTQSSCRQPELALAGSRVEEEEEGEQEGEGGAYQQHGGCHDGAGSCDQVEREGQEEEDEEEMRKRDLRDAAVAIVHNVMSAATDQLERELCVDNGLNGCYDSEF